MPKKTKTIEVVTGEKAEGDVDPSRAVEGKSAPANGSNEVGGREADKPIFFECAWCKAINYAEGGGSGRSYYMCFACGQTTRREFD